LTCPRNQATLPRSNQVTVKTGDFVFIKAILKSFCILLVAGFFLPSFAAKASGTIASIEIRGQKNIDKEGIRSRITTSVGSSYSSESIRADIDRLFSTGFFYNIRVRRERSQDGWKLIYEVVEKPPITEIIIKGNDDLSEDEIRDAAGLKTYTILSQGKIKESVDKIKKLYEEEGFFLAKVDYELQPTGEKKDTLALHLNIKENDKVIIKKVRIIGNKKLGDSLLKGRLLSKEGDFFSFMGGSGSFKQENLEKDVQILLHSYYTEGYIQAKISPPQTYVSPDKKSIYITFYVEEGLQYFVGDISFSGDLLYSEEELFEAIALDEKEIFSYMALQSDISAISAKYGDLGYAYVNIIPNTGIRQDERKVDVDFRIDKGEKVYFGKINVVGNDKTKDKVIRRELKIHEGELYHETRKRESLANIKRLGYFEDGIVFKTSTPPGKPHIMDIEIQVDEKQTGSIQVGAGYSSFQKFVLNGQIRQSNLFGNGQSLSLNVNSSARQRLFSLSFTEPYFLDTRWSTGFELYSQNEERIDFTQKKKGGAIRLGHPIGDYWMGFLRFKMDETTLELDPEDGDPVLFPAETVNGVTNSLTATIEYDKRDDRLTPRDGMFASASYEYAGLGGDLFFTKTGLNFRYYEKVIWELIWRNNVTYRLIDSIGDRDVPFNQLFLLGGPNSLRGFRDFSIGTRRYSVAKGQERPFGGKEQFVYNLEFEFPMIEEAGIRGVVFYDIGNATNDLELDDLRSNYGFGFRWITPFGPLRFEWGFPIDRQEELGEAPYNFEFSVGSPF